MEEEEEEQSQAAFQEALHEVARRNFNACIRIISSIIIIIVITCELDRRPWKTKCCSSRSASSPTVEKKKNAPVFLGLLLKIC